MMGIERTAVLDRGVWQGSFEELVFEQKVE